MCKCNKKGGITMGKIFLIGDTHFGDEKMVKLENRPFKNAVEQTITLKSIWNKTVTDEDTVIVVGDFIDVNSAPYHYNVIKNNLNGKLILIRGNHDTESDKYYYDLGFSKIYDYPIVLDNFWIVSHEPQYINKNFPYANIFAHVHNNPMYKTYSSRHYCVSAERLENFAPISFDDIKKTIFEEDKKDSK
jgi:calcineurin-like phosphoesterase family protein